MRFSPVLDEFGTYPFVRLDEARREAAARGMQVIDFGMGDPNEETESFIRKAVAANLPERCKYPRAIGLLELRRAIAEWCEKRFGVPVDSEYEIIPTLGSKEAIFTFAQVIDLRPPRDLVLVADPAYPVPGARRAVRRRQGGASPAARGERLPPRPRRGQAENLEAHGTRLGQLPQQPHRSASHRSPSTSGWRRWRSSTTSCSARTRPTRRSTSASVRPRRCRCRIAATSSSSTPSASAPR